MKRLPKAAGSAAPTRAPRPEEMSAKPYGCKDRVWKPGYWVKEREYSSDGRFTLVDSFVKHTMTTACRYDLSLADPRCEGCRDRGSGEAHYRKDTHSSTK
jgi:hypothetical protein